ncbi:amino acid ABC transporter permease [Mesorhizobium sp. M3A.F.Ca.ET.201.01.1.1]|uniref:amino acid ABC transporter permease n=1 Tax=Mesorhizobium sp. M3A.F.Ca.ET.201.01.1.1 TaxID=2563946 RepID=UPI001093922C|nr:amino acid ABC transporter permease [Mesorhizobium sp. M3A.F.Ca.ET.201.01.1.1]TGS71756.1 amino acid ABC transporter permease [Mesorhizobium sp. M3A.F.Ca.ET.201.01.1.1]
MHYDFSFAFLAEYSPLLVEGMLGTLLISVGASVLGFAIGISGAAVRLYGSRIASHAVAIYVEAIRNTPFLVQLFLFYFGLPAVGVRLGANSAAVIAMAFNVGAYSVEIFRSGLAGVHRGQIEAGLALGLSGFQIFRKIMLVPALRTVYPALTSQFILVMLTSSVVSVVSATDLTAVANDIASITFRNFEIFLVVTLIYLLMSLGFAVLFRFVERRLFPFAN